MRAILTPKYMLFDISLSEIRLGVFNFSFGHVRTIMGDSHFSVCHIQVIKEK